MTEGNSAAFRPEGDHVRAKIGPRLATLVSIGNDAALEMFLRKIAVLPDPDLDLLRQGLSTCGMVADETGHLMPELFSQIAQSAIVDAGNPSQFERIIDVFALEEVDACMHGRSVRADATQRVAEIFRRNDATSLAAKNAIETQVHGAASEKLSHECRSFRRFVRTQERAHPRSWYQRECYDLAAAFEGLAKSLRLISSKRTWRPWVS